MKMRKKKILKLKKQNEIILICNIYNFLFKFYLCNYQFFWLKIKMI